MSDILIGPTQNVKEDVGSRSFELTCQKVKVWVSVVSSCFLSRALTLKISSEKVSSDLDCLL